MPVGMAHVHLAHVPWVIRWRPRHFQTLFDAVPVFGVHVIHPHRHPYTLVCGLVAFRAERHPVVALAASTLPVFAQEDLALTGADATEGRGIAPVPGLLPSKLLEPREAFDDVGDVEDRVQSLGLHSAILPA